LGTQLFTKFSEEGNVSGLGWVDAETIRFNLDNLKIPHIGWNNISQQKDSPLLLNVPEDQQFYFVHSFYLNCKKKEDILITTNYGIEFVSAIQKENIFGVQFHPEKSHSSGLQILKNFAQI